MAKGILALIGKPSPGGEEAYGGSESEELPGDSSPATDPAEESKTMAAEDALEAFKSGDAVALSDALTRHYEACASKGGM